MLLFSYLESLGSPGQFRSNDMRKQSPVVHAQCVWRFWYNWQHLCYRPSLMYGMASRDAQKVQKPLRNSTKAWAAVMVTLQVALLLDSFPLS